MAALALDAAGRAAYYDRITSSHDYSIEVDVLDLNERLLGQATFLDGQVNVQRPEKDSTNTILRTGNLVLADAGDVLGVSFLEGQSFGTKLLRVRHLVEVPGYGEVATEVGTFVVSQPQGDSFELTVEVQDKSALAIRGTRPYTVKKGRKAVEAWVAILRDCTGERKFRVPTGVNRRLPDTLNVGWKDEASPWAICAQIAELLDMQQLYSSDGYATLRPAPTSPVWVFDTDVNVTELPAGSYDWTDAINHVRVGGGKNGKRPGVATAPATHPNSPSNLRRNGVDRWLPFLSDKAFKKYPDRAAAAKRILARELPMNSDLSWPAIPVFHLDAGDPVRLVTPDGSTNVILAEASIPLGVGDAMTLGAVKPLSRGYDGA